MRRRDALGIGGADIIAVSRAAHDNGLGGANDFHDANFLSFHRIVNFRQDGHP